MGLLEGWTHLAGIEIQTRPYRREVNDMEDGGERDQRNRIDPPTQIHATETCPARTGSRRMAALFKAENVDVRLGLASAAADCHPDPC